MDECWTFLNYVDRGNRITGCKTRPSALCPVQILSGLVWGRTSASALRVCANSRLSHGTALLHIIDRRIYLLTAIGLPPGGSSTVHIYTQIIDKTTQLIWEECGPCPAFASYTLAFALQLRKKHGKTSVRVAEECQLAQWKQKIQNRTYVTIRIHKHIIIGAWGGIVVKASRY